MNKRIISLFFLIFFLISAQMVKANELPADIYDTEFEKDVSVLSALGVVDIGEEGLFMPYSKVTRAEFAVMLEKLMKPENNIQGTKYNDVPDNHYAVSAIDFVTAKRYMNGYGNGKFGPDDNIKFFEIVKVAVNIIGSDRFAENEGGYYTGYLKIAQNEGLLDGVMPEGDYINKGNVAKLLVNLLDAHPTKIEYDGGRQIFTKDNSVTILNLFSKCYKKEGLVTANENYSLIGNDVCYENTIKIDSDDFLYYESIDYVGYNVECYYSINDYNEYVVEAIIPVDKKNDAINIKAENIEDYDNYIIEYFNEDNKLKKIKYDNNTVFIYNGKSMNIFTPDVFDFENGYIEWIDNDSDDIADCIKVFEYYNMVVEFVNEEKIVDKFDNEKIITIEEYKNISAYDTSGEKIDVSDIGAQTVASVYKSNAGNDDIVKIIVSDKKIEGDVQSTYDENGEKYVTIEGQYYKVYSGYKTYHSTSLMMGDTGIYLLDAEGKIVTCLKGQEDDFNIGLLVECKDYEDDSTGEYVIDLKVFTQAGNLINIKAKEKVMLDNEVYKQDTFNKASAIVKTVVSEPIRYRINADGELTILDTTKQGIGGNNDKLRKGQELTEASRYMASTKILEGRMVLDSDLILFIAPNDFENVEAEDFACSGIGYFVANSTYKGISAYYLEEKIPVDIAVIQAATSIINNKSDVALVQAIKTGLNEDDEVVTMLDVYVNGKTETWLTEDENTINTSYKIKKYSRAGDTLEKLENQKIEIGDLIKCAFDSRGAIKTIALIYDESKGEMISVNPYHTDFHEQGDRYVKGTIKNKYENYAEVIINAASESETKEYHNIGKGKIYRIEKVDRNFIMEEMSAAEIFDEVHNSTPTEVIIISTEGVPETIYVYE